MTGQVMCVHASILHIDSIAFFILCGRNLAVTSAGKSSSKAMSYFRNNAENLHDNHSFVEQDAYISQTRPALTPKPCLTPGENAKYMV